MSNQTAGEYLRIKNIVCNDCGDELQEMNFYNPYGKNEEQIRAGYLCEDCKEYARNKRR